MRRALSTASWNIVAVVVVGAAAWTGCSESVCLTCNCVDDSYCIDGERCLRIVDNAACGPGDETECSCVAGGEGEGEGDGVSECTGDDDVLGDGAGGLILAGARLEAEGTAGSDCSAEGGAPFDLSFTLVGEGVVGTGATTVALFGDDGTEGAIRFVTSSSTAPAFALDHCNGGPIACRNAAGDAVCACGLCIDAADAPSDLAVQVTVLDGRTSEGACVDL